MVWRRRLVWGAFIAASCGGESVYVGEDGGAGDAGAAGADDGASVPVTGGSTGAAASGGAMMGSTGGAVPMPPAAGTGGTSTGSGTGGAVAPPPIAGSGGGTQDGGGGDPGIDSGAAGEDTGSGGSSIVDPDTGTAGIAGAPTLPDCPLVAVTTTADVSPTDQCAGIYYCDQDGRQFTVICDGENDGTNTSLCECEYGDLRWAAPGLVQGEAPGSCHAGSLKCLASWPVR